MRQLVSLTIPAATFFSLCTLARAEVRYTVKDLGTLGGTFSGALAINASGDVVGVSETPDGLNHGFLYSNGGLRDLGVPFGQESRAVAINASSEVVIQSNVNTSFRSFLYNKGQYTDLGGLGSSSTIATGVNDVGEVVGYVGTATGPHAFLYSGGALQDLGTFNSLAARPQDINNAGQIVGQFDKLNSSTGIVEVHGFLYDHGVVQDLGTSVVALAINDAGDVLGTDFLYRNGQLISIGGMDDAFAINNAGVIVGSDSIGGSNHATTFPDGQVIDLNTLIAPSFGLTLRSATAINDVGQIAGSALTSSGEFHAFLLTPIPEPAGLAIVLLGTATLLRRRRVA